MPFSFEINSVTYIPRFQKICSIFLDEPDFRNRFSVEQQFNLIVRQFEKIDFRIKGMNFQ